MSSSSSIVYPTVPVKAQAKAIDMTFNLPKLDFHPELSMQKLSIGHEQAPLLVIDNLVAQADALVDWSASLQFTRIGQAFPGVRAVAPEMYQQFVLQQLQPVLIEHFQLDCTELKFSMCHYSLVTTPPEQLKMIQRIPHVDSFDKNGLATIHYLFRKNLGGTAFYRHRKTGYEYIDEERKLTYFKSLEAENDTPNMPERKYINGDTKLFTQIGKQEAVFNRMLVYRRNSLHSGSIGEDFVPDKNPLTGRLSLNSFIDPKL